MAAPYLPITLAGVDYLVDSIRRTTLPAVREQADTSSQPGEQSLNPKGLWRRSQESWHHGAGQSFLDSMEDRDAYRFRASKGIDVWTRGELSLLPVTLLQHRTTNTNLKLVAGGSYETPAGVTSVALADGTEVYQSHGGTAAGTPLASSPASYAPNLLNWASFTLHSTTGTGVWVVETNATIARTFTAATAAHEEGALGVTATAGGDTSARTPSGTSGFPVTPSTVYAALGRVERGGGAAKSAVVRVHWYDSGGALISTSTASTTSTGAFTIPATMAVTSPSNAAYAALSVQVLSADAGVTYHWDEMILAPNPYGLSITQVRESSRSWAVTNIQAGEAAQTIQSLTTDGDFIWAALGTSGIHRGRFGNYTSAANVPAGTFTMVAYAMGRLLAANANVLYEISSPIAAPAIAGVAPYLHTHPNTSFEWVGATGGRTHIYAWGNAGRISEVYKIGIEQTGVNLGAASFATQLPDGEVLHALQFYAGGVIMGTSKGVRTAVVDGAGNLDYGPLILTQAPVQCLEPQDRYCWFGWTNYDATSTGLGRLDLGRFNEPLIPAYASDIMATGQGEVTGVASVTAMAANFFEETRLFAVSGLGVYAVPGGVSGFVPHRVFSGTLETGAIRWATSVPKTLRKLELRHHALPAGAVVSVDRKLDDGSYSAISGSSADTGSSGVVLSPTGSGESAELRIYLTWATDRTLGAELVRYTLKALPTPGRNEVFQLPIVLRPRIEDFNGQTTFQDVDALFTALKALETAGTVVTLTIGSDSYEVYVDQIQFEGESLWKEEPGDYFYVGVATVVAQTVDV